MAKDALRVGGASAFWGDSAIGFDQLLDEDVDYIILDYLAEVTMSILARARKANPALGYATDFVDRLLADRLCKVAERGVKIVTNAGGLNPAAAAERIAALIAENNLSLKVAAVDGDDLIHRVEEMRLAGIADMFSGEKFPDRPLSINAYLGAGPIVEALAGGADIVVTGRCVDSALVLGPCMYHFGWSADDYDKLAAGSLAGHIIECGAQASGGIFTDWEQSPDWDKIGYPIATISEDGTMVISKARDTGGLVSRGTVSEQIVYEIGDPSCYHLPDVKCDFTTVELEEIGRDRVRVWGVRGAAPNGCYKVSVTHQDGYRTAFYLSVAGIDARRKADRVARSLLKRSKHLLAVKGFADFSDVDCEIFGGGASFEHMPSDASFSVAVLKIAARHDEVEPLEILIREAVSAGTSMAPGICGIGAGRPKVSPLIRLFSCLVRADVTRGGGVAPAPVAPTRSQVPGAAEDDIGRTEALLTDAPRIPLVQLAWARSGDKGDTANVGIIARNPTDMAHLRRWLTAERVAAHYGEQVKGKVVRYEMPGMHAFNFVLENALGGGGIASLRNDPQGKGFGQKLLTFLLPAP